ncbi:hypothetical protein BKG83_18385 [Mycobacteroides chelonae]|nr:hypothetical protein BKG83_18385 [Mycobacteroides chelonae]
MLRLILIGEPVVELVVLLDEPMRQLVSEGEILTLTRLCWCIKNHTVLKKRQTVASSAVFTMLSQMINSPNLQAEPVANDRHRICCELALQR